MASAHDLARGHKRLRALIEFALGEGWKVVRTRGGHLLFTKRNARAQLRRADRQAAQGVAASQENGRG